MEKLQKRQYIRDNIEDIIKLKNNGIYIKDIAKMYGVCQSLVSDVLKEYGENIRKPLTEQDIKDICYAYKFEGVKIYQLAKKYHKEEIYISKLLKDNGIEANSSHSAQIYKINEKFFDDIKTQEQAYIIGFLMADGNIHHNTISMGLQERDRQILQDILNCMNSTHSLQYVDYKLHPEWAHEKKAQNKWRMAITNEHLASRLKELGIVERKSLILQFPDWLTDELLPHFLRGYFDGDGSLSKQRWRVNYAGMEHFLNVMKQRIYNATELEFKFTLDQSSGKAFGSLNLYGKENCKKFLDYIYQDATIYLQRKYDIYNEKYINNSQSA